MGYAGITGASDVQAHSDDYFHFFNIQQVTTNVASKSCYISTAIVNTPPTANAGADYTIPKGTAFILEGSGSDPDVDSLSFCWEQADVGFNSQTSVSNTSTGSPAFRSMPQQLLQIDTCLNFQLLLPETLPPNGKQLLMWEEP